MTGVSVSVCQPAAPETRSDSAHLRLLATTDLHVNLLPYDYYADEPADTLGLARAGGLIERLRAEAPNCLLFDNGDFLQGNPMGDYIARHHGLPAGEVHPMIAAMNALEYDAVTLGNHEFNFGLGFLDRALQDAVFPVVSANVVRQRGKTPLDDSPLRPPYVLLDRTLVAEDGTDLPIRVGVVGLAPPQIALWDRAHMSGQAETRDMVEAAAAWAGQARAAGADLVVALCHSGIGCAATRPGEENAALAVAALDDIDAVVMGHTHLVFPSAQIPALSDLWPEGVDMRRGTLHGKPAVMAGFNGSHVGVIDLHLSRRDGGWALEDFACQARPIVHRGKDGRCVPTTTSLRPVAAAAHAAHLATLGHIRRPVGTTSVPLHSYFAQLGPTAALGLICAAQRAAVAEVLAGTPCADLPILSAAAPFKAGGRGGPDNYTDIPCGALALRHLAGLYHFPNTLRAVRMTGVALAGWLSRAAAQFNQVAPGAQDAPLIDPRFPSYNFDLIDGLTYEIDLSAAPGSPERVRDLRHDGHPLDPDRDYVVATNDYRAAGGGDLIDAGDAELMQDCLRANFDLLMDHVRRAGTVAPQRPDVWRFAPMPGTTVLFRTGLRAAAHLHEIAHLRPEILQRDDSGFLNLRLHL